MKPQEFFNIISDIDERFVNEVSDDASRVTEQNSAFSETQRPQIYRAERSTHKAFLKPLMCGAACLAIAGGAALGFATFARSGGVKTAPADVSSNSGAIISGAASSGVTLDNNSGQATSSDADVEHIIYPPEQPAVSEPQYEFQYFVDNKYKGMDGMRDYFNTHYTQNHGYGLGHLNSNALVPKEIKYSDDCLRLNMKIGTGCDIYAIDSGKVVYAGDSDYGDLIIIMHTPDDYSAYGYLDELLVKSGDIVENGTVIARSGSAQNYVDNSTRHCMDQISYDVTVLRFDRQITPGEWNLYAASTLAPTREPDGLTLPEYLEKEMNSDPLGRYYNTYYFKKSAHGCATTSVAGLVNRPSSYESDEHCRILDIKCDPGCDIFAFGSGTVVYAGASSHGNVVIIKHAEDDYTAYGYLDDLFVTAGDSVNEGDVIARSASARSYSNKADYDVEVLRSDKEITPDKWNDHSAFMLDNPWHSSRSMF
ncbi:MAG: M23 family metallopeptidase [Oscillospiraceae bacterium]|nr:M23 family metallopeptidase [Oscillospiraceae bacterium]